MENILQNQNFQIKLSQLLKNDWYTIGSFLRVPDKTLVSIRNDYVNFSNAEAKANEMIKTWISIDNHATFDKLKDSIKEIPKYDLLKEVKALKASLQTRELSKSIQPVNTSLVPKTRDTMDSDEPSTTNKYDIYSIPYNQESKIYFCEKIGSNWRMLGELLSIPKYYLESIEYDCREIKDKVYAMLFHWITINENNANNVDKFTNALDKLMETKTDIHSILHNQDSKILFCKKIGSGWRMFGVLLSIPEYLLEYIDHDCRENEDKVSEILNFWIKLNDINNTNNIEKLTNALNQMNKISLIKIVPDPKEDATEKVKIEELSIDRDNFNLKKVREISSCAFGKVYLCKDERTDRSLAMKCIETGNIDHNVKAKQEVENFRHEISLFQSLNHERIVKYFCTTYTSTTISIIMEFMEGGSLFDKISNEGALDEKTASEKSYQILCGLDYLHNKNIVHRDIKSANILLDLYGNCKLADFGISKQIQTIRSHAGCKSSVGTCYWMSPEVINATFPNFEYGKKADIWSFGCTVLEMLTTKPPWSHLDSTAAIFHIGMHPTIPHLPDNSSNSSKTFVNDCFQRDPKLRPNVLQLLSYDWVKRCA